MGSAGGAGAASSPSPLRREAAERIFARGEGLGGLRRWGSARRAAEGLFTLPQTLAPIFAAQAAHLRLFRPAPEMPCVAMCEYDNSGNRGGISVMPVHADNKQPRRASLELMVRNMDAKTEHAHQGYAADDGEFVPPANLYEGLEDIKDTWTKVEIWTDRENGYLERLRAKRREARHNGDSEAETYWDKQIMMARKFFERRNIDFWKNKI